MVGNTLKMSFQLFWCLHYFAVYANIPTFSRILECYVVPPKLLIIAFTRATHLLASQTISSSLKRNTVQPNRRRYLSLARSLACCAKLLWALLLSHSIAMV